MPSFEKNATDKPRFTLQIRPRRRKMPKDAENASSSVFRIVRNVAFSRKVGIEREKPGANSSAASGPIPEAPAIAHRPDLPKTTVELDGGRLHALPYSPK